MAQLLSAHLDISDLPLLYLAQNEHPRQLLSTTSRDLEELLYSLNSPVPRDPFTSLFPPFCLLLVHNTHYIPTYIYITLLLLLAWCLSHEDYWLKDICIVGYLLVSSLILHQHRQLPRKAKLLAYNP